VLLNFADNFSHESSRGGQLNSNQPKQWQPRYYKLGADFKQRRLGNWLLSRRRGSSRCIIAETMPVQ
jgi:hypothetical protein